MPSHTVASALIQLFLNTTEDNLNGAPWTFDKFKTITGISHGLFPEEDAHLPKSWTREQSQLVRSYFDQYARIPSETAKITFAVGRKGVVPGREIYRTFITELWRTSRMHDRITKILSVEGLHPITLAMIPEKGWVHDANDKGLGLPKSLNYIPLAVDPVARALFGFEALDRSGRLPETFRGPVQTLIQRTWTNIRNQTKRSLDKIGGAEEEARKAFAGDLLVFNILDHSLIKPWLDLELVGGKPTKSKIKSVILKVSKWQLLAQTLQTSENVAKADEILEKLRALMEGIEGKLKATQLDPEGMSSLLSR